MGRAEEPTERYAQPSSRDLSRIGWFVDPACFRLGIILEGTRARACAGRAPKAAGDRLHATAAALMARAPHHMRG